MKAFDDLFHSELHSQSSSNDANLQVLQRSYSSSLSMLSAALDMQDAIMKHMKRNTTVEGETCTDDIVDPSITDAVMHNLQQHQPNWREPPPPPPPPGSPPAPGPPPGIAPLGRVVPPLPPPTPPMSPRLPISGLNSLPPQLQVAVAQGIQTFSFIWRHAGRRRAFCQLWMNPLDPNPTGRAVRFWSPVTGWSVFHGQWVVRGGELLINFRFDATLSHIPHRFQRDDNDANQYGFHTWTDVTLQRHIVPHRLCATDAFLPPVHYL